MIQRVFVEGYELIFLPFPYGSPLFSFMQDNTLKKIESLPYQGLSLALAEGFQNLLGGILGYAMVLKERFKDDHIISAELNVIIGSAERALDLTKMLEGFSKYENNHKILCDLNAIVRKGVDLLFCTLPKNIQIKTKLDPELEQVFVDSAQLLQALMLIGFYARASIIGGGEITFETVALKKNSSLNNVCHFNKEEYFLYLSISFSSSEEDENLAKKEEYNRKQLLSSYGFEEFVASHSVSTRFVNNNGEIGIELYFPSPALSNNVQAQHPTKSSSGKELLKDKTVLVVDDDEIIRGLPIDILSDFGTHIFTASNGLEGVNFFKKYSKDIDLIILDVMMPFMDGINAFQEIRKINSEVPIIFISGYSEVKGLQPILAEKYKVGFLAKPFSNQSLVELIQQFLA